MIFSILLFLLIFSNLTFVYNKELSFFDHRFHPITYDIDRSNTPFSFCYLENPQELYTTPNFKYDNIEIDSITTKIASPPYVYNPTLKFQFGYNLYKSSYHVDHAFYNPFPYDESNILEADLPPDSMLNFYCKKGLNHSPVMYIKPQEFEKFIKEIKYFEWREYLINRLHRVHLRLHPSIPFIQPPLPPLRLFQQYYFYIKKTNVIISPPLLRIFLWRLEQSIGHSGYESNKVGLKNRHFHHSYHHIRKHNNFFFKEEIEKFSYINSTSLISPTWPSFSSFLAKWSILSNLMENIYDSSFTFDHFDYLENYEGFKRKLDSLDDYILDDFFSSFLIEDSIEFINIERKLLNYDLTADQSRLLRIEDMNNDELTLILCYKNNVKFKSIILDFYPYFNIFHHQELIVENNLTYENNIDEWREWENKTGWRSSLTLLNYNNEDLSKILSASNKFNNYLKNEETQFQFQFKSAIKDFYFQLNYLIYPTYFNMWIFTYNYKSNENQHIGNHLFHAVYSSIYYNRLPTKKEQESLYPNSRIKMKFMPKINFSSLYYLVYFPDFFWPTKEHSLLGHISILRKSYQLDNFRELEIPNEKKNYSLESDYNSDYVQPLQLPDYIMDLIELDSTHSLLNPYSSYWNFSIPFNQYSVLKEEVRNNENSFLKPCIDLHYDALKCHMLSQDELYQIDEFVNIFISNIYASEGSDDDLPIEDLYQFDFFKENIKMVYNGFKLISNDDYRFINRYYNNYKRYIDMKRIIIKKSLYIYLIYIKNFQKEEYNLRKILELNLIKESKYYFNFYTDNKTNKDKYNIIFQNPSSIQYIGQSASTLIYLSSFLISSNFNYTNSIFLPSIYSNNEENHYFVKNSDHSSDGSKMGYINKAELNSEFTFHSNLPVAINNYKLTRIGIILEDLQNTSPGYILQRLLPLLFSNYENLGGYPASFYHRYLRYKRRLYSKEYLRRKRIIFESKQKNESVTFDEELYYPSIYFIDSRDIWNFFLKNLSNTTKSFPLKDEDDIYYHNNDDQDVELGVHSVDIMKDFFPMSMFRPDDNSKFLFQKNFRNHYYSDEFNRFNFSSSNYLPNYNQQFELIVFTRQNLLTTFAFLLKPFQVEVRLLKDNIQKDINSLINSQLDILLFISTSSSYESLSVARHRIAPIQVVVGAGHPLPTYSPNIDYVILPKDSLPNNMKFSEKKQRDLFNINEFYNKKKLDLKMYSPTNCSYLAFICSKNELNYYQNNLNFISNEFFNHYEKSLQSVSPYKFFSSKPSINYLLDTFDSLLNLAKPFNETLFNSTKLFSPINETIPLSLNSRELLPNLCNDIYYSNCYQNTPHNSLDYYPEQLVQFNSLSMYLEDSQYLYYNSYFSDTIKNFEDTALYRDYLPHNIDIVSVESIFNSNVEDLNFLKINNKFIERDLTKESLNGEYIQFSSYGFIWLCNSFLSVSPYNSNNSIIFSSTTASRLSEEFIFSSDFINPFIIKNEIIEDDNANYPLTCEEYDEVLKELKLYPKVQAKFIGCVSEDPEIGKIPRSKNYYSFIQYNKKLHPETDSLLLSLLLHDPTGKIIVNSNSRFFFGRRLISNFYKNIIEELLLRLGKKYYERNNNQINKLNFSSYFHNKSQYWSSYLSQCLRWGCNPFFVLEYQRTKNIINILYQSKMIKPSIIKKNDEYQFILLFGDNNYFSNGKFNLNYEYFDQLISSLITRMKERNSTISDNGDELLCSILYLDKLPTTIINPYFLKYIQNSFISIGKRFSHFNFVKFNMLIPSVTLIPQPYSAGVTLVESLFYNVPISYNGSKIDYINFAKLILKKMSNVVLDQSLLYNYGGNWLKTPCVEFSNKLISANSNSNLDSDIDNNDGGYYLSVLDLNESNLSTYNDIERLFQSRTDLEMGFRSSFMASINPFRNRILKEWQEVNIFELTQFSNQTCEYCASLRLHNQIYLDPLMLTINTVSQLRALLARRTLRITGSHSLLESVKEWKNFFNRISLSDSINFP